MNGANIRIPKKNEEIYPEQFSYENCISFIKEKFPQLFIHFPEKKVFVTSRAVLTNKGSVFLLQRKGGFLDRQYELPGGSLEQSELLGEGMEKEVVEETTLKIEDLKNRKFLGIIIIETEKGLLSTFCFHYEVGKNICYNQQDPDPDHYGGTFFSLKKDFFISEELEITHITKGALILLLKKGMLNTKKQQL